MPVAGERLGEPTGAKRRREVVDEFRRGHTHRIETVLNRAVRDGHREVRFPTPGFSAKDQAAALSHEIGRECRAEERQTDGRLHGEIEIIDRLEEGEVGTTHHAGLERLLPLRDLPGDWERVEIAVIPLLTSCRLYIVA